MAIRPSKRRGLICQSTQIVYLMTKHLLRKFGNNLPQTYYALLIYLGFGYGKKDARVEISILLIPYDIFKPELLNLTSF